MIKTILSLIKKIIGLFLLEFLFVAIIVTFLIYLFVVRFILKFFQIDNLFENIIFVFVVAFVYGFFVVPIALKIIKDHNR